MIKQKNKTNQKSKNSTTFLSVVVVWVSIINIKKNVDFFFDFCCCCLFCYNYCCLTFDNNNNNKIVARIIIDDDDDERDFLIPLSNEKEFKKQKTRQKLNHQKITVIFVLQHTEFVYKFFSCLFVCLFVVHSKVFCGVWGWNNIQLLWN